MAAELRVNGQTFKRFKQVDLSRSVDTFAGEIRIITSQAPNNDSFLKLGDYIEFFLDGVQVFTGYIERISDTEDRESHDLSFRARDSVADLIDSYVPENVKSLENVETFQELVQLCIDGLGLNGSISIVDLAGAKFSDSQKLKAAETGQTVGDFLQENARIVQVFLNTDGLGNVLIQKPSGRLKTTIQNVPDAKNNNVKSSTIEIDQSKRFYKYTVYSNSSLASESSTVDDLNNQGVAIDTEIRSTRIFEKIAEKPMTADECGRAAAEEANIRRARSFKYSCVIAGFSANGELWEPGKEVPVKDTLKGVNGLFQTNTVKWSFSSGGEITTIDITLPDKGTVEAVPTSITERTTQASSTYIVQSGDTLSQIASNYDLSTKDLVSANPQIENPNLINVGQEINIPVSRAPSLVVNTTFRSRNIPVE